MPPKVAKKMLKSKGRGRGRGKAKGRGKARGKAKALKVTAPIDLENEGGEENAGDMAIMEVPKKVSKSGALRKKVMEEIVGDRDIKEVIEEQKSKKARFEAQIAEEESLQKS